LLLSGILNRTGPVGAYIDTMDSSANIINAMINSFSYQTTGQTGVSNGAAVQQGTTWRFRHINTVAFAMTLAAGTGVTLGTNVNIAASSIKEYLLTVTNGTPQQVFAASQVNGTAVITGLSQFQTALLSPGMLVTGTNIPASTTILSVQSGVGVTLSGNATATLNLNALTFNPTVSIVGIGQMLL